MFFLWSFKIFFFFVKIACFSVENLRKKNLPNLQVKKLFFVFYPCHTKRNSKKKYTMIAVVFPGQGSQKPHMGAFLLEHYGDLLKDLLEEIGSFFSLDMKKLLLEGSSEELQHWAQPSLFLMGALWTKVLEHRGFPLFSWATYGAGHSLGEYTALFSAGVFSFSQGLHLLKKRLECLKKAPQGSMGALLNIPSGPLQHMLNLWGLSSSCFIANDNSKDQLVLSGTKDSLDLFQDLLEPLVKNWPLERLHDNDFLHHYSFLSSKEKVLAIVKTSDYKEAYDQGRVFSKIKYVPLKVGGPFHCALMAPCQEEFLPTLEDPSIIFQEALFPLVSNTAPHLGGSRDPHVLKSCLKNHMISPVRWREIMDFFLQNGLRGLVEIGPGQVLGNLFKRQGYEGFSLALHDEESLKNLEYFLHP